MKFRDQISSYLNSYSLQLTISQINKRLHESYFNKSFTTLGWTPLIRTNLKTLY